MKPNGTYLVARKMVLLLGAVGLLAGLGSAETMRGRFKLPVEAHWGMMLLSPGEYEFTTETGSRMVTVRSNDARWSGMILSISASDLHRRSGSGIALAPSENGVYIESLYLGDLGVSLNFDSPKAGKFTKLSKTTSSTIVSASGTH